jgi:hypothetical protein
MFGQWVLDYECISNSVHGPNEIELYIRLSDTKIEVGENGST